MNKEFRIATCNDHYRVEVRRSWYARTGDWEAYSRWTYQGQQGLIDAQREMDQLIANEGPWVPVKAE